jgi:hypothetical protein
MVQASFFFSSFASSISFIMANILQILLLLATLLTLCSAQLGAEIHFPIANSTIEPGQKIEIQYSYNNMGNGTYTVDIDLWQDAGLTQLARNIDTNVSVHSGNSAGTKLEFRLNATYEWTVPRGLNSTVFLSVKPKLRLDTNLDASMRARGIMLHVNAGLRNLPMHQWTFLVLAISVLTFIGF